MISNFVPTIYFGLSTGFAMLVALLAALTLLPQLIILLKPLGPGAKERPLGPGAKERPPGPGTKDNKQKTL